MTEINITDTNITIISNETGIDDTGENVTSINETEVISNETDETIEIPGNETEVGQNITEEDRNY